MEKLPNEQIKIINLILAEQKVKFEKQLQEKETEFNQLGMTERESVALALLKQSFRSWTRTERERERERERRF